MLPSVCKYIVKVDVSAGIGHIASNSVWIEEALMNCNVFKSNITHGYSWLCLAGALLVERIQHASWTISVRFLHLLRADIYCPPYRTIHCEIKIVDVFNESGALVSWIAFNVYSFERADHSHISESNIADTVTVLLRRHTTHCHTYSQHNRRVLHHEIACTISCSLRFRHNHIIVVLHGEIVEVEAGA